MAIVKKTGPSMKLAKNTKPAEEEAEEAKLVEKEETKAEKPEATEKPQTLEKTDDLIVNTAKEVENLKEEKAFKLVPDLLNGIDKDYFKLGGVLSVIQTNGWFMDKNYENFRAYVENELGMAYRKSMYLIGIYNGLVKSGVLWSQVAHLGWTKLKELAPILTPDNVEQWVGLAENMTVLQLQEHIKSESAGASAGGDAPEGAEGSVAEAKKTTTMTFKLHEDQKETVRAALDKVKHETGTEFDSVALETLCLDFLAGDSKLKKIPTLDEMMKNHSAEEVLTIFGDVYPEVQLEATLPGEE